MYPSNHLKKIKALRSGIREVQARHKKQRASALKNYAEQWGYYPHEVKVAPGNVPGVIKADAMAKDKKESSKRDKTFVRKIEKSMDDKRAAFMKGCNSDIELMEFETKKRIVLYALKLCKGNVTNACNMVNITRKTFHNYKNDDQDFEEAYRFIKAARLDHVVDKLHERIDAGSDTAIIYYLNCQGKEEGWGNAVKVEGGMKNINYNVPLTEEEVRAYAKALEEEY